jgi:hypothetical protein
MQISTLHIAEMDISSQVPPPYVFLSEHLPAIVLFRAYDKSPPYTLVFIFDFVKIIIYRIDLMTPFHIEFRYYSGSGQTLPILKWIHSNVEKKFDLPVLAQFNDEDKILYKEQLTVKHSMARFELISKYRL